MSKKISDKDKQDWENFLSKNDTLPNKDFNNIKIKKSSVKLCDLHGYSLDEANVTIENFIKESYDQGIRVLKIITGKGLHSQNEKDPYISKDFGILKYSVPEFINNNSEINSLIREIKNADVEDGGSGAFYIYLRKKL